MLRLIKLGKEHREQLFEMMDEWRAAGEQIVPYAIRRLNERDFEAYLEGFEEEARGTPGLVPGTTLFGWDEERERLVGAVNIRHRLNDKLLLNGGHIGDGIRPGERGKGYGTQMVALALAECDRLGIRDVLMCCDRDNIASARTIVKNGGILENEVADGDTVIQRYWIKR